MKKMLCDIEKAGILSALILFLFCPSVFAQPIADIKVNGADDPLPVSLEESLTLTLSLDVGSEVGLPADWWLATLTPYGLYFFTPEGWTTDWVPAYQGPLFPLDSLALTVPLSVFPEGDYVLFFGVDTTMDRLITAENLYWDSAVAHLVSGPTIASLKKPGWESHVGEPVTLEGVFVRDPLPMLVTELDVVKINQPMPESRYIVLLGNNAQEISSAEYGGARLKVTGLVRAVDDEENYMGEYVALEVISFEMVARLEAYDPKIIQFHIEPIKRQPRAYAVLFSGGSKSASNHIRYWNDLKFMYSTLVNSFGYLPGNIAVLYANGKGSDNNIPVHYSATQSNLETVFNLLREHSTPDDSIFIFTTNHGGGFHKKGNIYCPNSHLCGGSLDGDADEPAGDVLSEATYNLDLNGNGNKSDQVSWDEDISAWGGTITDDAFVTMISNLQYQRMVIVMEQCFSGGLIAEMAQGGGNRIIMSAAGEYEFSWAMNTNYDEFSYHFTSAINGAEPGGKTVNADANNDGDVSMVEAFNYARQKDTQAETPWYEDSGDGIPHSGAMPSGGDGTLGNATFLN